MRRLVMMFGMGMVLILVAAALAVAVTKTCNNRLPCEGTENNDVLYERIGADEDHIIGFEGRDVIDANTFNPDRDVVKGRDGRDRLLTNDTDGLDAARGGRGRDVCYVSRGDTTHSCEVVRRATFRAGSSDVTQDMSAAAFAEGQ